MEFGVFRNTYEINFKNKQEPHKKMSDSRDHDQIYHIKSIWLPKFAFLTDI